MLQFGVEVAEQRNTNDCEEFILNSWPRVKVDGIHIRVEIDGSHVFGSCEIRIKRMIDSQGLLPRLSKILRIAGTRVLLPITIPLLTSIWMTPPLIALSL